MDFNVGNKVFYTCSNGGDAPAWVGGLSPEGFIRSEYIFQNAIKVVNGRCKMGSISFAIPSANSPPHRSPNLLVPLHVFGQM